MTIWTPLIFTVWKKNIYKICSTEESHTGLEQHEDEWMLTFFFKVNYAFKLLIAIRLIHFLMIKKKKYIYILYTKKISKQDILAD